MIIILERYLGISMPRVGYFYIYPTTTPEKCSHMTRATYCPLMRRIQADYLGATDMEICYIGR